MGDIRLRVLFAGAILVAAANASSSAWVAMVKACVARKDFTCAFSVVDAQLSKNPTDLEARTWHARLSAWSGSWTTAEREYKAILVDSPGDTDALLGLSDVQIWNQEFTEALASLDRAERAHAGAREVWLRRARIYVRLHREADAIRAYRALLQADPINAEARSALNGIRDRRNELRVGSDTDTFNYTNLANTESLSLTSRWNERWSTELSTSMFQRFGETAETAIAGLTYRLAANDWVTIRAGLGTRQSIAPEEEFDGEYGHGFRLHLGPIRGLESYASTRNLWYSASRVLTVGTTQVIYLPRDWTWTVRATAVRTTFAGANAEWVPSGFMRLSWPVVNRLSLNGLFAVGAENFSNIDQVGRFSAHTYGGGARVQLNNRQDITGYVAFQQRSQGRTQTSAGVSYGIRF